MNTTNSKDDGMANDTSDLEEQLDHLRSRSFVASPASPSAPQRQDRKVNPFWRFREKAAPEEWTEEQVQEWLDFHGAKMMRFDREYMVYKMDRKVLSVSKTDVIDRWETGLRGDVDNMRKWLHRYSEDIQVLRQAGREDLIKKVESPGGSCNTNVNAKQAYVQGLGGGDKETCTGVTSTGEMRLPRHFLRRDNVWRIPWPGTWTIKAPGKISVWKIELVYVGKHAFMIVTRADSPLIAELRRLARDTRRAWESHGYDNPYPKDPGRVALDKTMGLWGRAAVCSNPSDMIRFIEKARVIANEWGLTGYEERKALELIRAAIGEPDPPDEYELPSEKKARLRPRAAKRLLSKEQPDQLWVVKRPRSKYYLKAIPGYETDESDYTANDYDYMIWASSREEALEKVNRQPLERPATEAWQPTKEEALALTKGDYMSLIKPREVEDYFAILDMIGQWT